MILGIPKHFTELLPSLNQEKLHELLQKTLFPFRNTTVNVELENVNDNTPSFTRQKFSFTAKEVSITLCFNSSFLSSPRRV